ncbi:MAG: DUF4212 domain-containing protein [Porticoccaceae bacterium]|nr:DUF4212 domain-containing protein [Porticoccaceae bacterium]MDG1474275.1 DUF4212 domain-containing protein [Porticoccaceae bacterium]
MNNHKNPQPDPTQNSNQQQRYWQANLRLLGKLLAVWFVVSFGFGIILADWLDQFSIAGFKLGFWFAQQGAIYIFVILIFVYARQMKSLDKQFGVSDEEAQTGSQEIEN